MKTDKQGM